VGYRHQQRKCLKRKICPQAIRNRVGWMDEQFLKILKEGQNNDVIKQNLKTDN